MDKNELTDVLNKVLDERSSIDRELHKKHHKFVDMMIDEHERKKARNEGVKRHVIGWTIVSAISGTGYLIWEGIVKMFHR